jgi:hypothetical protein
MINAPFAPVRFIIARATGLIFEPLDATSTVPSFGFELAKAAPKAKPKTHKAAA